VIGSYEFVFPSNYSRTYVQGFDSQPGYIQGEGMTIGFDYGYYSSSLVETPEEYIESEVWKIFAFNPFMRPDSTYYNQYWKQILLERLEKKVIDKSKPDSLEYMAICRLNDTTFNFKIDLPEEIRNHKFEIDTINGHYRKIVRAKNSFEGTTGMYIYDIKGFSESFNAHLGLSISTSGISSSQQDSILRIFKSVNVKK